MAKVICSLPNASELISGVKFVTHKLGMISEEIEDDVAAMFTSIKGYVLHGKNAAKEIAALKEPVTQSAEADASATDAATPAAQSTGEAEAAPVQQ
ncbi:hypothetical protein AWB80_07576 [Caballeronia pedi]|uniref:Uncharacterized protein n=1 Tax=Caballeronia pedi TaxID=1777141 RepID=A0A158DVV0_9BURK|nr:hypothetical protein [Caballeronia pedi]SAK98725.1 hypothetical protein AWB80_07576 [Caballeronia pedi]